MKKNLNRKKGLLENVTENYYYHFIPFKLPTVSFSQLLAMQSSAKFQIKRTEMKTKSNQVYVHRKKNRSGDFKTLTKTIQNVHQKLARINPARKTFQFLAMFFTAKHPRRQSATTTTTTTTTKTTLETFRESLVTGLRFTFKNGSSYGVRRRAHMSKQNTFEILAPHQIFKQPGETGPRGAQGRSPGGSGPSSDLERSLGC